MSAENVELARKAWERWIAGDVDGLFELFHPDITWDTTTFDGWPEAQVYRGQGEVRRFLESWLGSWDRFESGVDSIVDAGNDQVVVFAWQRGYGLGSSAPVEMSWAQVLTLRDGLAVQIDGYSDRRHALVAAGLDPDAATDSRR